MNAWLSKWPICTLIWSPERLCAYKSLSACSIIMFSVLKRMTLLGILNVFLLSKVYCSAAPLYLSYHSFCCCIALPSSCRHNLEHHWETLVTDRKSSCRGRRANFRASLFSEHQNEVTNKGGAAKRQSSHKPTPSQAIPHKQWAHNLFDVTTC